MREFFKGIPKDLLSLRNEGEEEDKRRSALKVKEKESKPSSPPLLVFLLLLHFHRHSVKQKERFMSPAGDEKGFS